MVLLVDPETLVMVETPDSVNEWTTINGCKYYTLTQHVFAVIYYRIHRAAEAVRDRKLDREIWRGFASRFYWIASMALREQGAAWIEAAELEGEKQLTTKKINAK